MFLCKEKLKANIWQLMLGGILFCTTAMPAIAMEEGGEFPGQNNTHGFSLRDPEDEVHTTFEETSSLRDPEDEVHNLFEETAFYLFRRTGCPLNSTLEKTVVEGVTTFTCTIRGCTNGICVILDDSLPTLILKGSLSEPIASELTLGTLKDILMGVDEKGAEILKSIRYELREENEPHSPREVTLTASFTPPLPEYRVTRSLWAGPPYDVLQIAWME